MFALGADGLERAGEGRLDAMSFIIAGPDRFLMSGHPEPAAGRPAHFGLPRPPTPGGRGGRSLEGEADFHALEAAGDRVYGVDSHSGRLMITEDGRRWRDLGQVLAADVAAHPGSPDPVLLTAAGSGSLVQLQVSGSPELVEPAPPLVLLDWDREDLLVGAGTEGSGYRSDDGGDSWREVGSRPGRAPRADRHRVAQACRHGGRRPRLDRRGRHVVRGGRWMTPRPSGRSGVRPWVEVDQS